MQIGVKLAQALRLETVAEGVEEAGQATRLRAFGADVGHGYHFARPQDPSTIGGLITQAALRSA
jgi:EAL domain-containing protein (putative c-di-GMP-specific phosphodiesterase class I)